MSRSGYSDECGGAELTLWRQAVRAAMNGKRGQAFLRELAAALDEMPTKELYDGNFATAEGQFCTLGVIGAKRGTKMDDLGDDDYCNAKEVGARFGIARAMAAEIMYMNDDIVEDERNDAHAQRRWQGMRKWVERMIGQESAVRSAEDEDEDEDEDT